MAQITVSSSAKATGHRRFAVMLLLLLIVTINYIDRANLAVAGPTMAKEFGWSLGSLGLAFSALFWVYTPGLLIWGALIDVVGTRLAYAIGLFIWALASLATGAVNSFGHLLGARWALGIGESVMPSACAKAVREWMPASERGVATGIFTAGYYAGPAIGFPVCAWLMGAFGWRGMFYVLGAVTLLFFVLWLFVYYRPEDAKWIDEDERSLIVNERDGTSVRPANVSGMTRLDLLRHPTTWGLIVAQAASVYTSYLFLTWLPAYLLQTQHLDLKQVGAFSSLPFVVALIVSIGYGWLSDRWLNQHARDRGGRKLYVVISMFASMAILLIPFTANFAVIMLLLSVSLAGSGCTLTANVSLANDMLAEPKYGGLLFGLLGIGSNTLALLAPIVTGFVAEKTGAFAGAFIVAGALSALGISCVLVLVRKPITSQ